MFFVLLKIHWKFLCEQLKLFQIFFPLQQCDNHALHSAVVYQRLLIPFCIRSIPRGCLHIEHSLYIIDEAGKWHGVWPVTSADRPAGCEGTCQSRCRIPGFCAGLSRALRTARTWILHKVCVPTTMNRGRVYKVLLLRVNRNIVASGCLEKKFPWWRAFYYVIFSLYIEEISRTTTLWYFFLWI